MSYRSGTAVVIGAGPAGLTAAFELLERTRIRPIVVEGSGEIGGLARTIVHAGNRMDLGGHRFFSKSDRVMRWWLSFLPIEAAAPDRFVLAYFIRGPEGLDRVREALGAPLKVVRLTVPYHAIEQRLASAVTSGRREDDLREAAASLAASEGVGVEDLVIIETSDALLVSTKERADDVKLAVEELKRSRRTEQAIHRRVYRPWGYYQSVDTGTRYQVKRIVVKPGAKLSLQKHFHRAEHWVVVRGTAEVTIGETVKSVHENESIYIPIGSVHRLANPGKIPLELIEVQVGSYLGEDDIVRMADVYGRVV